MWEVGVMHKLGIEGSLQTVCESALERKSRHSMVVLVGALEETVLCQIY